VSKPLKCWATVRGSSGTSGVSDGRQPAWPSVTIDVPQAQQARTRAGTRRRMEGARDEPGRGYSPLSVNRRAGVRGNLVVVRGGRRFPTDRPQIQGRKRCKLG